MPKGAFPDLDDYLYGNEENEIVALKPGLVSEPIFTADAHYLLKVLAAAEDRELNNTMGQKLLQENVLLWQREALVAGTTAGTVRMNFNSRLYDWVTNQVFITAPRIDRPTPVPDLISGVPLPGPGP